MINILSVYDCYIFFCFFGQKDPVNFLLFFFTFQGPHGTISIEIFYLDVKVALFPLHHLHLGLVS